MYELLFSTSSVESLNQTQFQYKHVDKAYSCSVVINERDDINSSPPRYWRINVKGCIIEPGESYETACNTNSEKNLKESKKDYHTKVKEYKPNQHLDLITHLLNNEKIDPHREKCLLYLMSDFANYDFNSLHTRWSSDTEVFKRFSISFANDQQFQDYYKNYFKQLKNTNSKNFTLNDFTFYINEELTLKNELNQLINKKILPTLKTEEIIKILEAYKSFSNSNYEVLVENIYLNKKRILNASQNNFIDIIKIINFASESKYYDELKKEIESELQKITKWTQNKPSKIKDSKEYEMINRIFNENGRFSDEFFFDLLKDQTINQEIYNNIFDMYNTSNRFKSRIQDKKMCKKLEDAIPTINQNNPEFFYTISATPGFINLCGEEILTKNKIIPPYTKRYFKLHCKEKINIARCKLHFNYGWIEENSICKSNNECKSHSSVSILLNKNTPDEEVDFYNKSFLDKLNYGITRIGSKAVCINNKCQADIDYCNTDKMFENFHSYIADNQTSETCNTDKECLLVKNYLSGAGDVYFNTVANKKDYMLHTELGRILYNSLDYCKNITSEYWAYVHKTIDKYNSNLKAKCIKNKCKGVL